MPKKSAFITIVIFCTIIILIFLGNLLLKEYLEYTRKTAWNAFEKPDNLVAYEVYWAATKKNYMIINKLDTYDAERIPPAYPMNEYALEELLALVKKHWGKDYQTIVDNAYQYDALFTLMEENYPKGEDPLDLFILEHGGNRSWTPEIWQQCTLLMEQHETFLEEIHAVLPLGRPVRIINTDLASVELELKHLDKVFQMTRWLCYNAITKAKSGDTEEAFQEILHAFQSTELMNNEPVMFGYLYHLTCIKKIWIAIGEAFPPGTLNREQINILLDKIQTIKEQDHFQDIITAETISMRIVFDSWERLDKEDLRNLFGGYSDTTQSIFEPFICHLNQSAYINNTKKILELSERPFYTVREEFETFDKQLSELGAYYAFASILLDTYPKLKYTPPRKQVMLDQLSLSLKIGLYYQEHGKFPETLAQVDPKAPLDPFSGNPYCYIPQEDDFMLYSVAGNGIDDGGQHEFYQHDLVWRERNSILPPEKNPL